MGGIITLTAHLVHELDNVRQLARHAAICQMRAEHVDRLRPETVRSNFVQVAILEVDGSHIRELHVGRMAKAFLPICIKISAPVSKKSTIRECVAAYSFGHDEQERGF
ncbi:hypothetical protein EJ07DRAFT_153987 [Lizonia empirigonia]|nr:hypothetical protein EJ07DRAFT_153987 [Lizonia empirigonia]